ncbi:ATP-binding protein [Rickettsia endosymbiont of Urophora cardui]|uniref:ATP-binding protein n=1 Tax=Rickettsia endosymbiont of Urophora cardui TaxID=3066265 RepID=UPI00313CA879
MGRKYKSGLINTGIYHLVFAKWNTIFKDEMTTSAVIDRLVHHSSILELNTESYRIATAKGKKLTIKSEDNNVTL